MNRRMLNRWSMLSLAVAIIVNIECVHSQKPQLGSAINMLKRYGHLSENARVMMRNVSDTWIYREPSVNVLRSPLELMDFLATATTSVVVYNVQIKYCSNAEELVQEYFRDFKFAGVDKPSRAFTGDWSKSAIARHFGLNESYIADEYRYIFLKVGRTLDNNVMFGPPGESEIDEAVAKEIPNVLIGDTDSADRFIDKFGTHYISSFSTGDFIYQVFVYIASRYNWVKRRMEASQLKQSSEWERNFYFSPGAARHVGKIQSASGRPSVETWAANNLVGSYGTILVKDYSTLIKMYGNFSLSSQLDEVLGDSALLRMELNTLSPVFKCSKVSKWFEEYIHKRLNETIGNL